MWAANVYRILYMVKVNILSALFFFIIQGCSVTQEISRLYFPQSILFIYASSSLSSTFHRFMFPLKSLGSKKGEE